MENTLNITVSYILILYLPLLLPFVQLSTSQGNDVLFLKRPQIERTNNETIIKGCQYNSSRNENLNQYAFINFNGTSYNATTLQIDNTDDSDISDDGIYTVPRYSFPYRISTGDIQCMLKVGEEIFYSNTSEIYEHPGMKQFPFLKKY